MQWFVTGATGFVGGAVARQLIAAGHQVRALVRSSAPPALSVPGVTCYQGDITSRDSLREPMTGVDGVFHIAGWYKIGAPDAATAQQVNVDGTRNVLATM